MRLLYQKASFDNVSEIMGLIQGAILLLGIFMPLGL